MEVADKTDKSPSRRHGFPGEHASDVLTELTVGRSWFIPKRRCPNTPAGTAANIDWVCCAGRSGFREAAACPVGPWATGRRQGVPAYVFAASLAPGGVSGRLGANRGAVDGSVNDNEEFVL